MTGKGYWTVAACAVIVLAGGCKGAEDEFAPAVVPKTFAFEGKVEPKYVGVWASVDGSSTLDLNKEGALKIETVSHSVAGKGVTKVAGEWRATGDQLMFKYAAGSQPATVLKYAATLTGSTLNLLPDGGHVKTTYKKK